jgi:PAS domain S-box-containing protein
VRGIVLMLGWLGLGLGWAAQQVSLERLASQERLGRLLENWQPGDPTAPVENLWNELYPGQNNPQLARWRQTGPDTRLSARELAGQLPPFEKQLAIFRFRGQLLEWGTFLLLALSWLYLFTRRGSGHKLIPEQAAGAATTLSPPLLRAINSLLLVVSPEGKIQAMNQAACQALGYTEPELLGLPYQDIYFERTELMSMASRRDLEGVYRTRGGGLIPVRLTCSVMRLEGDHCALITLAQDLTEQRKTAAQLEQSECHLKILLKRLVTTQEAERRSLARDLHDGMQQYVVAAQLQIHALGRGLDPVGLDNLARAQAHLAAAVEEGRRLTQNLRPPGLLELGLVRSLTRLLEAAAHEHDWLVEMEDSIESEALNPALETAIYRMIQEAINNARKHARTSKVRLELGVHGGFVQIQFRDWGRGFDSSGKNAGGMGLRGMRERVEMLGGWLQITSQPGEGCRIQAGLPISQPDPDERPSEPLESDRKLEAFQ